MVLWRFRWEKVSMLLIHFALVSWIARTKLIDSITTLSLCFSGEIVFRASDSRDLVINDHFASFLTLTKKNLTNMSQASLEFVRSPFCCSHLTSSLVSYFYDQILSKQAAFLSTGSWNRCWSLKISIIIILSEGPNTELVNFRTLTVKIRKGPNFVILTQTAFSDFFTPHIIYTDFQLTFWTFFKLSLYFYILSLITKKALTMPSFG